MNWLHRIKPPFLHLDLKLGNLLVDQNWNVKVAGPCPPPTHTYTHT
jgi:ankyrin repeat/protein kinase domain-containing protein 1